MNVFMGDVILRENEGRGLRVDLGSPDRTLFIEVRDNVAYLFHEKIRGPGGLPYGSSGMSICALGNRESLLAAYLMMKRGNLLYFIYIPDLFPDPLAGEEVIGFLNGFLPNPVLHEIEGAAGENILLRLDAEATKRGASAVVVGFGSDRVLESIEQGQFAPIEHPVFYPLVGLGEDEVKTRLESLTTGEYSKGDGAGR